MCETSKSILVVISHSCRGERYWSSGRGRKEGKGVFLYHISQKSGPYCRGYCKDCTPHCHWLVYSLSYYSPLTLLLLPTHIRTHSVLHTHIHTHHLLSHILIYSLNSAEVDYTPVTMGLSLNGTQTTQCFNIETIDNDRLDFPREFEVRLEVRGQSGVRQDRESVNVTITDNDGEVFQE